MKEMQSRYRLNLFANFHFMEYACLYVSLSHNSQNGATLVVECPEFEIPCELFTDSKRKKRFLSETVIMYRQFVMSARPV